MTRQLALCLTLMLAACTAAERPDLVLRRDFAEVELNRIGDFHPSYSDYEDAALLSALNHALRAGVPKTALKQATVAPVLSTGVARLPGLHGQPNRYDIWLRIASCDTLINMTANAHGRLFAVHDKDGCLPSAPVPKKPKIRY